MLPGTPGPKARQNKDINSLRLVDDEIISFKNTIIGSDNGLSPIWHQAIILITARLLLIGPLETNFKEKWTKIQQFSFTKMLLTKKCQQFCRNVKELTRK